MSKHRNVSFPCNQCDHITNMPASLRYHTRAKHYYILCICVLWVYLWIYCVRWPWWLQCFSNPAKCSPPLLLIQTIICLLFRSNWNIPPNIEIFLLVKLKYSYWNIPSPHNEIFLLVKLKYSNWKIPPPQIEIFLLKYSSSSYKPSFVSRSNWNIQLGSEWKFTENNDLWKS